jgi:hypothetical protein
MRKIKFVVLVITVVFLVQLLFFYRGVYLPHVKIPDYLSINVNSSLPIETTDSFTSGSGTVLIDLSHENKFNIGDINLLLSRIIARGYNLEYLRENYHLEEKLPDATSLVVISPESSFSTDDVKAVKMFVDKGGILLMLSEPTGENEINSLASEFGILFWDDYLYNLLENDGNFKYIYLTDFAENNITKDLNRIVFYTSCSVFGNGLIFTDNNTYSSSSGEKGRYSVAVMTEDSQVLAIGDATFLSEPYNALDNNRLIYNIADFLAPPGATAKPKEFYPTAVNVSNVSRAENASIKIPGNNTVSNVSAE